MVLAWLPVRLCGSQGGSQAIVEALLRGIGKCDGHLLLRSRVRRIAERPGAPGVASAIELENGRFVGVNEAVVSNASVWDTARLLCRESVARAAPGGESFHDYHAQLEMNDSMLHLHVGFKRKPGAAPRPVHFCAFLQHHPMQCGYILIEITRSAGKAQRVSCEIALRR